MHTDWAILKPLMFMFIKGHEEIPLHSHFHITVTTLVVVLSMLMQNKELHAAFLLSVAVALIFTCRDFLLRLRTTAETLGLPRDLGPPPAPHTPRGANWSIEIGHGSSRALLACTRGCPAIRNKWSAASQACATCAATRAARRVV